MKSSKTALLSVYHKEGIVDFAKQLHTLGWKLLASGGTANALKAAKIPVTDVATMVGAPILGHRVVTLSQEIHAGLLAQDNASDLYELHKLKIPCIDLVCVDLYPLLEEIKNPQSTILSVIEKTDIGGPTMLRSAAKGRRIVVCHPEDRQNVIEWLKKGQPDKEKFISALVAKAEALLAQYCLISAQYHGKDQFTGLTGEKILSCKYGENGWQTPAALYKTNCSDELGLDKFKLIAGTDPSYNNMVDVDRMLQTITHIAAGFDKNRKKVPFIAVAVKHGNPCGASVGKNSIEVLEKTVSGDTRAIFGGVVMTNFPIGVKEAETLLTFKMEKGRRLLDGIIAPSFTKQAIERLTRKGDKCRFLANPALAKLSLESLDNQSRIRFVRGGFLSQPNYTFVLDLKNPDLEKTEKATTHQENDLLLAWAIGSTSNSNTITFVRDGMLLADAVGQQDRVGACELAVKRATDAGHSVKDAVAYSDSFFPFPDGPLVLIKNGISCIFVSKGSVKDDLVRHVCKQNNVSLYLFPDGLGRGFFGH